MTASSENGRWVETEGIDTLFSDEKPVSTLAARLAINNALHLRDTSTLIRVCAVSRPGNFIAGGEFIDDPAQSSPLFSAVTPWTVFAANKLARPVLRVGATRSASGTSYLSAALFPYGAQPRGDGAGALAVWPETSFTNTSPAIVIEAAADISWSGRSTARPGFGRPRPRKVTGFAPIAGSDPITASGDTVVTVDVMLVHLVVYARGLSTAVNLSLVELREFAGP